MIKKIEKIHTGEDYTIYSYLDEDSNEHEVEITGIAQEIINQLGESLCKQSFLDDMN
jgi:hypothetical protein